MLNLPVTHPDPAKRAVQFAQQALTELPKAYQLIKGLGLLGRAPVANVPHTHLLPSDVHAFRTEGEAASASASGTYAQAAPPGGVSWL